MEAGKSSCSCNSISLSPQLQFLHALRVFLTSQSGRCTAVARLRSSSVSSEDSSIVGVCVPFFEVEAVESVNAQRAAFFAARAGSFFLRSGSAADILAGAVARTCRRRMRDCDMMIQLQVKHEVGDCADGSGEGGEDQYPPGSRLHELHGTQRLARRIR